jgi:hypothetical protein
VRGWRRDRIGWASLVLETVYRRRALGCRKDTGGEDLIGTWAKDRVSKTGASAMILGW